MQSITELLSEFDALLRIHNPQCYNLLQDPLDEQTVLKYMADYGVEDLQFKNLYLWKNGINDEYYGNPMFGLHYWGKMNDIRIISEAIEIYRETDYFNGNLIPLFTNGSGDEIFFNNLKGSKDYQKLHLLSVSLLYIAEPITIYDSIYAWLTTEIDAYKSGVYTINEKGMLEYDDVEYSKIADVRNPKSAFWR